MESNWCFPLKRKILNEEQKIDKNNKAKANKLKNAKPLNEEQKANKLNNAKPLNEEQKSNKLNNAKPLTPDQKDIPRSKYTKIC